MAVAAITVLRAGFVLAMALTAVAAEPPSSAAQSAAAPVFTAAQAEAGQASYQKTCAGCHAIDLSGNGDAPELAGTNFMLSWKTQTTQDLFKYVQGMPPGGPHLAVDEYIPIVAYILRQNGAASGDRPFDATTSEVIQAVVAPR